MREREEEKRRHTGGMVVLHDCTGGDDGEGVEVGVRGEVVAEDGEGSVVAGPGDVEVKVFGVDVHVGWEAGCLLPPRPRWLTRCVLPHTPPPPPHTCSPAPNPS